MSTLLKGATLHKQAARSGNAQRSLNLPARLAGCAPARRERSVTVQAARLDARAAVKSLKDNLHGSADPAYTACASYLKGIGFTNQAELARVLDIATNPNSLFISYNDPKRSKNASARPVDADKDIAPVVEFLRSQDVAVDDIVKVTI